MSDTSVQEPNLDERYPLPDIAPDADIHVVYKIFLDRVKQIDEDMDIQADPEAATRKIVRDRLIEKNEEAGKSIATEMGEKLNQKFPDPETQAGVYFAFMQEVAELFEDQFEAFLTQMISHDPSLQAKASSASAQEELVKLRAEAVKQAKMMRDVAQIMPTTHFTEELFPSIPTRKGKSGERGKRAIGNYDWFVNGVPQTGDNNNLPDIAKRYGYTNSKELRDALQKNMGLKNLRENLPDTLTLQLKAKSEGGPTDTLLGKKKVTVVEAVEDQTDGENDDDDDDDDETDDE